ncbi:hypothetical protein CEXT_665851 [Caerostris extrusa]|uniref:Uncharacterized protein n=1 Tax=Caerostris extrusa TaxID=172846 RepID=A0AAV4MCY2_CAEEX|nr:hypothetical protein CEXT_665851 [Caerostris extrusa]
MSTFVNCRLELFPQHLSINDLPAPFNSFYWEITPEFEGMDFASEPLRPSSSRWEMGSTQVVRTVIPFIGTAQRP